MNNRELRKLKEAALYEYFIFSRKRAESEQRIQSLDTDYLYIKSRPLDGVPGHGSSPNAALYRLMKQKEEAEAVRDKLATLEEKKRVQLGLDRISDEDMRVLQLRYGEFRTYTAVADELRSTVSDVQYRINRILDNLIYFFAIL